MIQNSNFQALLTGVNPGQLTWLHIKVNRENILEDTLNEIVQRPQDLKKPLKVAPPPPPVRGPRMEGLVE